VISALGIDPGRIRSYAEVIPRDLISPRGPESASRKVARKAEQRLEAEYPSAEIIRRDLVSDGVPHLDSATLKAISTKDGAEAQRLKESASLSDKLTDELLASDLRAEGMNIPPLADSAVPNAERAVESLAL